MLQYLSRKDGLANDQVHALCQDRAGNLWIATEGGVTRYRPARTPPAIRLTEVVAERRYGPVTELELPVSQRLVSFVFHGRVGARPQRRTDRRIGATRS